MSSIIPTVEQAIDQLIHSPRLPFVPFVARELQAILESEQEKHQRFYDEMSESEKVEFINGEVVVQSPVKLQHYDVTFNLAMILTAYTEQHNLGRAGHEKLLVSLTRNDYEPDVCFWNQEKAQHFTRHQMKFPAPTSGGGFVAFNGGSGSWHQR